MTRALAVAATVAGVVVGGAGAAHAGLRGVADGWLVTPTDLAAVWNAPAGRPDRRTARAGIWLAAGQTRLWGMPELPVRELAAGVKVGLGSGRLSLGGAWQKTGTGIFAVDRVRLRCGWEGAWGWRLTAERPIPGGDGAGARSPLEWNAEVGPNLALAGGGILRVRVTVAAGPSPPATRAPRPLGHCTIAHAGVACALAWERRPDGGPTTGAELCAAVAGDLALGFRFDGASRSIGPELAARVGSALIRTSHVVHPVLGITHRVEVFVGTRGATGTNAAP